MPLPAVERALAHGVWTALVLIAVAGACRQGGQDAAPPPYYDHRDIGAVLVPGRVLYEYGERSGLPYRIAVAGDLLVVLQTESDSAVAIHRKSDGRLIVQYGPHGDNPGAFGGAQAVLGPQAADGIGKIVWIYDLQFRRLTQLDLLSLVAGDARVPPPIIDLQSSTTTYEPLWLCDTAIIALGTFERGRFALFDRSGRKTTELGPLPPGNADVPVAVRQHAYQASAVMRPDRTRLATVTRNAGQLAIYRPDGSVIAAVAGPYRFEPAFRVADARGRPLLELLPDNRVGYVKVTATEDLILALFSGRVMSTYPASAAFGQYVHVFDWSGRFLGALELDSGITAVDIDRTTEVLYAVRALPRATIVVYPIKDVLSRLRASSSQ